MSRTLAALLLALASVTLLGRSAAAQSQASTGPGPAVHPGTRLAFPPTLGGAQQQQSFSYGASAVEYFYIMNKMQIFVSIYDGGRRVPGGNDTPALMNQFSAEANQAENQLRAGGFKQFERPTVPSTCVYGAVSFRCLTYSVSSPSGRLYSKLLMTGYHDNFLKIRIDWSQGAGQTPAEAEQALAAFVGALFH